MHDADGDEPRGDACRVEPQAQARRRSGRPQCDVDARRRRQQSRVDLRAQLEGRVDEADHAQRGRIRPRDDVRRAAGLRFVALELVVQRGLERASSG
jgi:hypothetical protein